MSALENSTRCQQKTFCVKIIDKSRTIMKTKTAFLLNQCTKTPFLHETFSNNDNYLTFFGRDLSSGLHNGLNICICSKYPYLGGELED